MGMIAAFLPSPGPEATPVSPAAVARHERDPFIDLLRGLAIVCVVLGHAIQCATDDFDRSLLFRFIYSFHMPLFMFLSGWVAGLGNQQALPGLKKRSISLLLPCATWALFFFLIWTRWPVTGFSYTFLWFLWVLYLNHTLLFASFGLRPWLGASSLPLIALLTQTLPLNFIIGWSLVKWHSIFFFSGYLYERHRHRLPRQLVRAASYASLVLFPFMLHFWRRSSAPTFAHDAALSLHTLSSALTITFNLAVPFAGMLFIARMARLLLTAASGIPSFFRFLGAKSLDIYVSHLLFVTGCVYLLSLAFRALTPPPVILLATLAGILFPLAVSRVLRKSRLLQLLFYGKMTGLLRTV